MDKLTKKDELVKELTDKFYFPHGSDPREIADFILADRKRICAPLVKYMDLTDCPDCWMAYGRLVGAL